MSDIAAVRQLATLLSGRWQIPLAALAAIVASATLYQLMPGQTTADLDTLLADVAALEEGGATTDAADALANLLEMKPALPPEQRAALHDRLADLVYRQELTRSTPNLQNARLLLAHHHAADELGCPRSAGRSLRAARAAEWLGRTAQALPTYRAVLEEGPTADERRQALQGLVRLLENRPDAQHERQELLESLLDDESVSVGYLWWGLQHSLREALDDNDTIRARLLLGKYGPRLKSSDLKGYWEYLWAWVMVHEGRPEQAEPLVHWVDEWLETRPESQELSGFGRLPAMNRWLLGQIYLAGHRPQAALEAFEEAIVLEPHGDLFIAATTGQARALAELERHAAARRVFRDALKKLALLPAEQQQGIEQFRRSLLELFEKLRQNEDHASAADYLVLAAELTPEELTAERSDILERLGHTYQLAADETADAEPQRSHHARAGRYLEQAAELARADEPRCAALRWSAVQEYDRAGHIAATRRVLLRFLEGRSRDPRLPQAYLRLGRTFEADGQFSEALDWYGRLAEEFPVLAEAYRARLLSAGCLQSLGRAAEAERVLTELLEDDNIAPQAPAFHDALLELGDLLYQRGRYGEAISRLEDFATLYPDDPERIRSRFMLADAYRRSAAALRENAPPDAAAARVAAASQGRLRRAAELFAALLRDLAAEPAQDEASAVYERLALFYRADCLFDLNEPATLQEALATYQRGAARYEREPPALTAHVQIANIYLRMGMPTEAARTVERARWLLQNMPDSALAAYEDGADRDHWRRYLAAISSSGLFRGAFAGKRQR